MTKEKLQELIQREENPKLDFKQEWYWNKNTPRQQKQKGQGEFVRDIIALANGHPDFVYKTAYLIIGIEDKLKKIYDFDKNIMEPFDKFKQEIVEIINNYAQPNIIDLDINWVDDTNHKVLVISIKPQEELIHLSKDLQVKNKTIDRGTTFFRVGENNRVPSPKEIKKLEEAIKNHKENRKKIQRAEQLKSLKLFEPKREINNEEGFYQRAEKNISLWAELPIIFEYASRLTIECEITIIENSTKIIINISEKEILENLFSGYKFKPKNRENERKWLLALNKKNNMYTIWIGSTFLNVSPQTVKTLIEILDDLHEVYVDKLKSITSRLYAKNFPYSKEYPHGFELCKINLSLWKKMQNFIKKHNKVDNNYNGQWNIFNGMAKPDIIVYNNKSDKMILKINTFMDTTDNWNPKIILVWNTLTERDILYDNDFISVEESYKWIYNQFIPQIKKENKASLLDFLFKKNNNEIYKIESCKKITINNLLDKIKELASFFYGGKTLPNSKNILEKLYEGLILILEHSKNLNHKNYLYSKLSSISNQDNLQLSNKKEFIKHIEKELQIIEINNNISRHTVDNILRCCIMIMRDNFDSYSDVVIHDIEEKFKKISEIYNFLKIREERLNLI